MKTVCRFLVGSDVHYKAETDVEKERFEAGMRYAYAYAALQPYAAVDALFIVGDFANSGSETEMLKFKGSLDRSVAPETKIVLSMASHEFHSEDGEAGALARFGRIFGQAPDVHAQICGFHFISLTTESGCRIKEGKQAWLREELKKAAADDPKKPIFVFQHPHLSGTVYGSVNWGEDDIIAILMDYPQAIDFSGHSHAPINDPRSIHQRYFTSVGTGSFSYFELDEFDMLYGTVPPDADQCAQFHIVEVRGDDSVLIKPFDVPSGRFFEPAYLIGRPWDPASFVYTDARYKTGKAPYFTMDQTARVSAENGTATVCFPQAKGEERPNTYTITVRNAENNLIVRQINVPSSYYLQTMPEQVKVPFSIAPGSYRAEIRANGFWHNASNPLTVQFDC